MTAGPVIWHLALAADWEAAEPEGEYRISTLGRTLDDVGFIHLCHPHQLAGVAAAFYREVTEPLVLLTVDPARLTSRLVREPPAPGVTELFPHLYGPLPVSAVIDVAALSRDDDGNLLLPDLP